jgi:hypothetical protein
MSVLKIISKIRPVLHAYSKTWMECIYIVSLLLKQMCVVYFRYIEGLQADRKHISHWDKLLKATPENTPIPDASRLPAHWLGNGVGNHGNIVNALWTLRDFMMRDALGIKKVI